jgi:hypothetical protein
MKVDSRRGGGCNDSDNNDSKEVRDTMTMTMMMLQSPQMGRMTSATAVKPFKQQSTFQASGSNDLKEETWQMGRQHNCGWRTMDN